MIIEAELRADLDAYRNEMGLVDDHPSTGHSSGNSPLYDAQANWILRERGFWSAEDAVRAIAGLHFTEVSRGLHRRSCVGGGLWTGQDSPDNYVGRASLSAIDVRISIAAEILDHGRNSWTSIRRALEIDGHTKLAKLLGWVKLRWVFNNVEPGTLIEVDVETGKVKSNWGAWLGRQPQLIAHFQFCNREGLPYWRAVTGFFFDALAVWLALSLGWWNLLFVPVATVLSLFVTFGLRRTWWAVTVAFTGQIGKEKGGEDPWILSCMLVKSYRASGQSSPICDWAVRRFLERLFKKYPGGLPAVLLVYFGDLHPNARYSIT